MKTLLYGRALLINELPIKMQLTLKGPAIGAQVTSSYVESNGKLFCKRCHHKMIKVNADECICQEKCAYCRHCIKMGKVRQCSELYSLPEPNEFNQKEPAKLAWTGTLSEQQQIASETIMETIRMKETRLLWAVAGAGKTEMLFEGIERALKNKERVCIASPRVDVCLELAPRIAAAFPNTPLAVLYGEREKPYEYTQLVIATTHQLFRFREAFDVLIIDEMDAFPFRTDESLHYAANKAKKDKSALIYLSATPNEAMQTEVKKGKLQATILPARYHGYPLPVPKAKWCANWRVNLLKKPLKTSIGKQLEQRIKVKKRFLVFVPNIEWMLTFEKMLRRMYPHVAFESVSAEDPKRKEKIMQMRELKLQFLITSTILERGVTFPNVDVLVIGAENRIFTESALVQIAGRCGRSPDYPSGDVLFFHDGQSMALKKSIKQINQMNHLARKRGLIR